MLGFNKINSIDKLQAYRRVVMLLRGAFWKLFVRLVMTRPKVGRRLSAFGWPELTHGRGQLTVGDCCFFGKGTFKVTTGARLNVGHRVLINNGFVITANELVEIGDDSLIGEYVSIRDADHEFADICQPIASQGNSTAPIRIGSDVWIGRGSVLLKGVSVGNGAIIGANSVVTRDVDAFDIVAGNPAKRIRSRKDHFQ